jgi:hypothetical protein
VVQRCAVVRSAVEVWGDATSIELANIQATSCYEDKISPWFKKTNSNQDKSWRVNFRRFGRAGDSGMSSKEKQVVLEKFGPILRSLDAPVNLENATHELVLLEDWSRFHEEVVIAKNFTRKHSETSLDKHYKPTRYDMHVLPIRFSHA